MLSRFTPFSFVGGQEGGLGGGGPKFTNDCHEFFFTSLYDIYDERGKDKSARMMLFGQIASALPRVRPQGSVAHRYIASQLLPVHQGC